MEPVSFQDVSNVKDLANKEFKRLQTVITRLVPQAIVEHVGSTAVSGLAAKPIIDILAGVQSLENVETKSQSIRAFGYQPWFSGPGRVSYERRNSQQQPTHHLHFVVYRELRWREQLAFRDALRASASDREAYERLKRYLAARYTDTRDYSEAKTPFIRSVLSRQGPSVADSEGVRRGPTWRCS